jgi:hypothetical protein
MPEEDSRAAPDKQPPAKQAAKREANLLKRRRSFARERSSVLRPPEQSESGAVPEESAHSFTTPDQEDSAATQSYKEKIAEYHQRLFRATDALETPESSSTESSETETTLPENT